MHDDAQRLEAVHAKATKLLEYVEFFGTHLATLEMHRAAANPTIIMNLTAPILEFATELQMMSAPPKD